MIIDINIGKLYKEHQGAVRKALLEFERDYDTVDDLVQTVFLHAIEVQHTYAGQSSPLTWLVGIAKNVGREHVRAMTRDKRAQEVLASEIVPTLQGETDAEAYPYYEDMSTEYVREASWANDPASIVEAEDAIEKVYASAGSREQKALLLHHAGHTRAEIAEALGVSPKTASNLLAEARKKVRELS